MTEAAGGTPGTAAEEALRLLDAVQGWARRTFPPPQGEHPAECQWCPVCQLAAVLRGEHPEITARITEAGLALAGLVRSLADAASAAGHDGQHRERAGGHERTPRVQPIRLADPLSEDPEQGAAGTTP